MSGTPFETLTAAAMAMTRSMASRYDWNDGSETESKRRGEDGEVEVQCCGGTLLRDVAVSESK